MRKWNAGQVPYSKFLKCVSEKFGVRRSMTNDIARTGEPNSHHRLFNNLSAGYCTARAGSNTPPLITGFFFERGLVTIILVSYGG